MAGKKRQKLFEAIYRGDGRKVRTLLEQGVSPNARDERRLDGAVRRVGSGGGVACRASCWRRARSRTNRAAATLTARRCAARRAGRHLSVMRSLLGAGADPGQAEADGFTPLAWAVRERLAGGGVDAARGRRRPGPGGGPRPNAAAAGRRARTARARAPPDRGRRRREPRGQGRADTARGRRCASRDGERGAATRRGAGARAATEARPRRATRSPSTSRTRKAEGTRATSSSAATTASPRCSSERRRRQRSSRASTARERRLLARALQLGHDLDAFRLHRSVLLLEPKHPLERARSRPRSGRGSAAASSGAAATGRARGSRARTELLACLPAKRMTS